MSDEMIKFKSSGLGGSVCGHDSVMECNDFMQDMGELPDQPKNESELDSYVKAGEFSSGGICCNKESGTYYYFSGMKFGDFSTVKDIPLKPTKPSAAPAEAEPAKPDMEITPEETKAAPAAEVEPAPEKPDVIDVESEEALYDTLRALGEGEYAIVDFSKPMHKGSEKYERAFRRMAKKHSDKATFVFVEDSASEAWKGFSEKLTIDKKAPAVFAMDREGNCYEVQKIYRPFQTIKMLEKGKQTTGIIAKIEIPEEEPAPEAVEIPLEPIPEEEPSWFDEAIGAAKKVDPIEAIMVAGGIAVVTALVVFRKKMTSLARSIGQGIAGAKDSVVAKIKSSSAERKAAADAKAAEKKAAADAKAAEKKAAKKPDAKLAATKPEAAPKAEEEKWVKEMRAQAEEAAKVAKEREAEAEKKAAEGKKAAKKAAAEAKKKAAAEKKKKAAEDKAIAQAQKEHKALINSYGKKKAELGKVIDPALKQSMIAKEQMIIELNVHEQIKGEAWYIKLNPNQRIEVLRKFAEGEKNIGVEGISKIVYSEKLLLKAVENPTECNIVPMVDEAAVTIIYEEGSESTTVALERGLAPKQQKLFMAEYDAIIKQIKLLPLEVRVRFLELGMDADGLARRLVMQRHVTGEAAWKAIITPFGKGKGIFKKYPPKFVENKLESSGLMADPLPDLDAMRDAIPNMQKYLPSTEELKKAEEEQKAKVEAEAKKKAEEEAQAAKKKEEAEAKAKEALNAKRLAQFKKDEAAKKKAMKAWIAELDKIKDPELKARLEGIEQLKKELHVHEYLKDRPWYQKLDPNERVATITAIVEGTDHLIIDGKEMEVRSGPEVYDEPILKDGEPVNYEWVTRIFEGEDYKQIVKIPMDREMSAKDAKAFAAEYDALVDQVLAIDKEIKVTFLDRDITTDIVVSRLIMRRHVMSDAEWKAAIAPVVAKKAKGIQQIYPKALVDSAAKNIEGFADPIIESAKTLVTIPKMQRQGAMIITPEEMAEIKAKADAASGKDGTGKAPPPPPPASGKKPSSTPPPPPAAAKKGKGNGAVPPPPPAAAGKKPSSTPPPPPATAAKPEPSAVMLGLDRLSEESAFNLDGPDLDELLLEEQEVCIDKAEEGKADVSSKPPVPPPLPKGAADSSDAVTLVPPPPKGADTPLAMWERFEKSPYFEGLDPAMKSDLLPYKVEIGQAMLDLKSDPAFKADKNMMVGEMFTLEGMDFVLSRNFGVSIKGASKADAAKPKSKAASKKAEGKKGAEDAKDSKPPVEHGKNK